MQTYQIKIRKMSRSKFIFVYFQISVCRYSSHCLDSTSSCLDQRISFSCSLLWNTPILVNFLFPRKKGAMHYDLQCHGSSEAVCAKTIWMVLFLQCLNNTCLLLIPEFLMTLHHPSCSSWTLVSSDSLEVCCYVSLIVTRNVRLTQRVQEKREQGFTFWLCETYHTEFLVKI